MSPVLLLAALLAPAPAAESPEAFVTRLYAAYRDPDFTPFRRPERVFAPPLAAALEESFRLSREEVGFIDADPLCQCQDPSGLKATLLSLRRTAPAAAEARLSLRFGARTQPIRLKLTHTSAGWRIADIATSDEPSFLADLRAWNRRKRSGR